MKSVQVTLDMKLVPLTDDQRPAWDMSMQILADRIADAANGSDGVEEIQDGEIVETSYEVA